MSTHTKGPWIVRVAESRDVIETEDGLLVGFMSSSSMDGKANARLIAAAPELLEALSYAVDNSNFNSAEFDRLARAAIAKAKGEPA